MLRRGAASIMTGPVGSAVPQVNEEVSMSEPEPVITPRFRADACGVGRGGRFARLVSATALLFCSACYHYRAVPAQPISEEEPGGAPALATEYESETVWALAWGLVQNRPNIDNCEGQGLAEVRVTTNLGYTLLTIATLGFASPARVEWRCAKATPAPEPIGRPDLDPAPSLPQHVDSTRVGVGDRSRGTFGYRTRPSRHAAVGGSP